MTTQSNTRRCYYCERRCQWYDGDLPLMASWWFRHGLLWYRVWLCPRCAKSRTRSERAIHICLLQKAGWEDEQEDAEIRERER